jgi:hypothetical protein
MKTRYSIVTAIILAALSSTASAQLLYNSTSDFNAMGTAGTTMPPGWSFWYINGSSSNLDIPTSADMATAVQGSQVLTVWNATDGATLFSSRAAGFYAGNEGSTATDPNRLLGTSPTQVRGDILQLSLANTTGAAITTFSLSYNMSFMAPGTLKDGYPANSTEELPGYNFYYLDGSTWTYDPSLSVASAGQGSDTITLAHPVANGGNLQFAWFDDDADPFSPDDMYAIGNVNVEVPEPAALSLFAVGALALMFRRRKA